MAKEWYKSKTLWMGILQIIAGVVFALNDVLITGGTLTISGIIMIILRIMTKEAVLLTSP